jgi:cytochrome c553
MQPVVVALTEDDVKAIAHYYESVSKIETRPATDTGKGVRK